MSTTQSKDPDEKVDHPRHYNQHPSGIEAIEVIEHLPGNLFNAVKYIWRCGLKQTEKPLRDLQSARWYTLREKERCEKYNLFHDWTSKTDGVWRPLAGRVIFSDPKSTLADYLGALLTLDFDSMIDTLDGAIRVLECKHGTWESDEHGVRCCVFCGVTEQRRVET